MSPKSAPNASQNKNASSGTQAPVKTFRLGRIKAAVWENESEQRKFYNVTFARTYLDNDKKFHDADSFGRDDLPLVAKLADQAHTFIFERPAAILPSSLVPDAFNSALHPRTMAANSAGAERSFLRDRLCSLWRNLPPARRCAAGARLGPP